MVLTDPLTVKERQAKYQAFAVAFSYPDEKFFSLFPRFTSKREVLMFEYDRLFRFREIWLYGAEHLVENEFQRVSQLADISGFYKAFGVATERERPDLLTCELEFMHYLIFKQMRAEEKGASPEEREKAALCLEAQKKFFEAHLYPAVAKIAEKILNEGEGIHEFYREATLGMLEFLESEKEYFASVVS